MTEIELGYLFFVIYCLGLTMLAVNLKDFSVELRDLEPNCYSSCLDGTRLIIFLGAVSLVVVTDWYTEFGVGC